MTLGRPKSFDPHVAVQNALECFWSNGFEATSLQDLLDCTGLSKSSLYESFGSKQALFETCLTTYREDGVGRMTQRLAAARSGLAFVTEMLESVTLESGAGTPRGCLVMNTAVEFAQKNARVADLVSASISDFSKVFHKAVKQAQAEGEIPKQKDANRLALFIVSNMSGLRTLAKAGTPQKELRSVARTVIQALQAST